MKPLCVIVGPPGSGKTTVGAALAERLGVAFRDTDLDIETLAGKPIPEIFIDEGEDHFRALESQAVADALTGHDGVLALGGGAVLADANRALLDGHRVVFLNVGLSDAVRRVGLGAGRPLLEMNPRATLKVLMDQRLPLYRSVATVTVETDDRDPAGIVDELLAHVAEHPVRVSFGEYDAVVGRDLWSQVPSYLTGAAQAAILHTAPLAARAAELAVAIADAGVRPLLTEVPDAEAAKSVEVAAACWDRLGEAAFTRTDVVIGLGGGAVTDLAGFVAATWLRGVRVVHLPTSLLGMVDAAIGGKTGVNVAAGKNLVGAFHPPAAVLCDLSTLDSLPPADLAAGLAEVVKCGFIADPEILRRTETDPKAALTADSPLLADIAARAVKVKADVVTEDLRESGRRAFLNYGHTFAHAIEKVENYTWRHGDAVAVGMVYAAHLGRLTGRVDVVDRTIKILESLGLPTTYRAGKFDDLLAAMRVDKKSVGATMRFVLLDAIGAPTLVDDVTEAQLRTAYAEVSST